jgi:TM2 domain-containing membrane protein YozV
MECVNHPGVEGQAFCQNCGKSLCAGCIRRTGSGQVLCDPCLTTVGSQDANQAFWQAAQAYVVTPRGTPNPSAAAVLGLIPGVGAMYNGQLFKGLIHVVIFAVLVSMTENYGVFGIFIGAWVLYQSFEAFHTAKARRDGQPLPDPFGLNELGSWLNLGGAGRGQGVPPVPPVPPAGTPPGASTPGTGTEPPAYSAPYTSSWTAEPGSATGPTMGSETGPTPGQAYSGQTYAGQAYTTPPYNEPYPGTGSQQYQDPYGYPPGSYPPGSYPPGYVPPVPPVPPRYGWRGREPVWAVVLIVLGLMFLLKTLGFVGHLFHYAWPLLLIGFGVWMIIRRVGYTQGGSK